MPVANPAAGGRPPAQHHTRQRKPKPPQRDFCVQCDLEESDVGTSLNGSVSDSLIISPLHPPQTSAHAPGRHDLQLQCGLDEEETLQHIRQKRGTSEDSASDRSFRVIESEEFQYNKVSPRGVEAPATNGTKYPAPAVPLKVSVVSATPPSNSQQPTPSQSSVNSPRDHSRKEKRTVEVQVNLGTSPAAYEAIVRGDMHALAWEMSPDLVVFVDNRGNTPYHLAAQYGQLKCLRWLLSNSSMPVRIRNDKFETPAHLAAKYGHLKSLKALVSCGRDKELSILCAREEHGMTVLHLSTAWEHVDVVSYLVQNYGRHLFGMRDKNGALPLHIACAKGNFGCLIALCSTTTYGLKTANIQDNFGATAAHYCAQGGHMALLEYLINQCKATVSCRTSEGLTLLHAAAQGGHLDVAKFVVRHLEPQLLIAQASDGATCLHYASAAGHTQLLQFFMEQRFGASALRVVDGRGATPAHDAAAGGHVGCLQLLLGNGLLLHERDEDDNSPYSLAIDSGNMETVAFVKSMTFGEVLSAEEEERFSHASSARELSSSAVDTDASRTSTGARKPKQKKRKRSKRKQQVTVAGEDQEKRTYLRGEFILREKQPKNFSPGGRPVGVHSGYQYMQKNRSTPVTLPMDQTPAERHVMALVHRSSSEGEGHSPVRDATLELKKDLLVQVTAQRDSASDRSTPTPQVNTMRFGEDHHSQAPTLEIPPRASAFTHHSASSGSNFATVIQSDGNSGVRFYDNAVTITQAMGGVTIETGTGDVTYATAFPNLDKKPAAPLEAEDEDDRAPTPVPDYEVSSLPQNGVNGRQKVSFDTHVTTIEGVWDDVECQIDGDTVPIRPPRPPPAPELPPPPTHARPPTPPRNYRQATPPPPLTEIPAEGIHSPAPLSPSSPTSTDLSSSGGTRHVSVVMVANDGEVISQKTTETDHWEGDFLRLKSALTKHKRASHLPSEF